MKNWKILLIIFAIPAMSAVTLVRIGQIKATGTPSSTTYLRGDGTWTDVRGAISMTANNYFSYNSSTGVISPNMAYGTLTDGATVSWDASTGLNKKVTIAGDRTLSITNLNSGDCGIIWVTQDGTGGRTLTLPGGSATLDPDPGATTVLSFSYEGTDYKWTASVSSSGSGTLTNFSAGDLSPLFTTSEATTTTTPALTFSLSTAAAHTFFGNNTGSTGAPSFSSIGLSDLPTITVASGGTGNTSATAYALLAGGITSTGVFQSLTTGSSGQILRSGGSSALPAWSTATYPATASTSGNVLTSDGTNFTSSANNGGWTVVRVSGSDFTTTNSALTDVTGLVTGTLSTATLYEFEASLYVNSSTTAGMTVGVDQTGTGSGQIGVFSGTATSGAATGVAIGSNSLNTASAACVLVNGDGVINIKGLVKTGSSGTPTIKIKVGKVTSGTAKVYINSPLKVRVAS
jgi:hypothetical protein